MTSEAGKVFPTAAVAEYSRQVERVLGLIFQSQANAIGKAACLVADVVERGGIVYTFGSGHSLSIAIELYYRAGGMACFDVVHDKTFGRAERLSGYAAVLLDSYPISQKDMLIVVSNSGRNPLPVEMALEARKRGLLTVGITSLAHSQAVQPRNPSGLKLYEVCDVVVDNCGVPGDASVEIEASGVRVGPTSTLAGVFIVNCIVASAAEQLNGRGVRPPVLMSMNLDEGDSYNQPYLDFIRERIRGL